MDYSENSLVLLDSNVWIQERLLSSTIGQAFLFFQTERRSRIVLPNIVEDEVTINLEDMGLDAWSLIEKSQRFLHSIGIRETYLFGIEWPKRVDVVRNAIRKRMASLSGGIEKTTVSPDEMRGALHRLHRNLPPSGRNNEQYRDCCIWEICKRYLSDYSICLITNDKAFYEDRNWKNGLSRSLHNEIETRASAFSLYSSLSDYLQAQPGVMEEIDHDYLSEKIEGAVTEYARKTAKNENRSLLGKRSASIRGFTTPKEGVIAISFSMTFEAVRDMEQMSIFEERTEKLEISGECSYDPSSEKIANLDVHTWSLGDKYGSKMHVSKLYRKSLDELGWWAPDEDLTD